MNFAEIGGNLYFLGNRRECDVYIIGLRGGRLCMSLPNILMLPSTLTLFPIVFETLCL